MEKAEKDNTVKQRMQDILLCVSWREIANTYFDRPASWLYNKLNGIDDNGGFTEKEKELLRGALFDLSERIRPDFVTFSKYVCKCLIISGCFCCLGRRAKSRVK